MSSTENEGANPIVITKAPSADPARVRTGIIVPAFIAGAVVALTGWLYLLSKVLMIIFIWLCS